MKTRSVIFILFLLFAVSAAAQDDDLYYGYTDSTSWIDTLPMSTDLPTISFRTDNFNLMRSFYPDHYKNEYSIRRDIRSVLRADSSLMILWDSLGNQVMGMIEVLSGVDWIESHIDIHLMKYLPVYGMYDPLALPVEGIKHTHYIEAAPGGMHRFFNLIRLMAGRNLKGLTGATQGGSYFANHPLLDDGAYRFDNLSLALALVCAQQIMHPDSLENIFSSDSWHRHNPGWELFNSHFRYAWQISPEFPLLYFLAREPFDSPLVSLTKPPRPRKKTNKNWRADEQIRLSAGGGRLGFSVIRTLKGYLEVIDIDSLGLAQANGLMVGDKIKRVNGEYARNARELMGKILDKIDTDGVYIIALRDNEEIGLLMLPQEEIDMKEEADDPADFEY